MIALYKSLAHFQYFLADNNDRLLHWNSTFPAWQLFAVQPKVVEDKTGRFWVSRNFICSTTKYSGTNVGLTWILLGFTRWKGAVNYLYVVCSFCGWNFAVFYRVFVKYIEDVLVLWSSLLWNFWVTTNPGISSYNLWKVFY